MTMKKKTYGAKRLLMLVTALLVTATISAADYLVYSVVGTAKIYEGSKTVALNARKTLTTASKLVIGKESAVTVIDEVNSKMYSFTTEGTNEGSQGSQEPVEAVSELYGEATVLERE